MNFFSADTILECTSSDPHRILILAFAAVGGLLAFFLLNQRNNTKRHYNKRRSPGDPPWQKVPGALPVIGNLIPGGPEFFDDVLQDWAAKYGKERGVYECNLLGTRTVVVCNQETLKYLEKYRASYKLHTRTESEKRAMRSLGAGDSIFTAEGHDWRKSRRMISPFLNKQHIGDYVSSIKLVGSRLCEKWEGMMSEDGLVTINSDLSCTMMDITSLILYGQDINSIVKGRTQLDQDIQALLKKIVFRSLVPFEFWKIPIIGQYLDGGGWRKNRMRRTLIEIIDDNKKSLLSAPSADSKSAGTTARIGTSLGGTQPKLSFLTKLLMLRSQEEEESYFDIDRLIGNLLSFFTAGTDTIVTTLSMCLYILAGDRGLQEKIASESLACLTLDKDSKKVNSKHLYEQSPRTISLVYGPVAFLVSENLKPINLDGTELPVKTQIIALNGYAMTSDFEKQHTD